MPPFKKIVTVKAVLFLPWLFCYIGESNGFRFKIRPKKTAK
mgnify:CR=1 FL=1